MELSAGRVHAPVALLLVRLAVGCLSALFCRLWDVIAGERLAGGFFVMLRRYGNVVGMRVGVEGRSGRCGGGRGRGTRVASAPEGSDRLAGPASKRWRRRLRGSRIQAEKQMWGGSLENILLDLC